MNTFLEVIHPAELKQVSQLFLSLPCSVLMPLQPSALGVMWWDDVALILLPTPLSLWLVLLWGFLCLVLAGSTTRGNICAGCYRHRRGDGGAVRRTVCTTLDARLSWQRCGLPLWYAAFYPGPVDTQPEQQAAVLVHLPPRLGLSLTLLSAHSAQSHQPSWQIFNCSPSTRCSQTNGWWICFFTTWVLRYGLLAFCSNELSISKHPASMFLLVDSVNRPWKLNKGELCKKEQLMNIADT